GFGALFKFL
uniref:Short cationic peptide-1f n=1 Tax=Cupiennius salei TaxID=6928 RepID=TXS1F_CUPSA|nr:RecName: Full=Short cationic peptide-1f; Short=SCP-1f; AltName: Full=Cupiennin 1-like peptide-1f; AltName: Full=Truncated variant of Cupiennin 1 family [Cupiennius salei]